MRTIKIEIRNPFMCHPGQFEEGRTLVVGIRKIFLNEDAILQVKIGKKTYEALTSELRTKKATPHTTSKGGVSLMIMPLYYFDLVNDESWKHPPVYKKEEGPVQQTLI